MSEKKAKQERKEAADVPMVAIPRNNAVWLLSLLDQITFKGSQSKQNAAVVQTSLERALKG